MKKKCEFVVVIRFLVFPNKFLCKERLPLKRQVEIHLKMSSAEVVCCKYLPCITIDANCVDQEQTAHRSSLIWFHTVCHRGSLNISADEKSRRLLLRLAH